MRRLLLPMLALLLLFPTTLADYTKMIEIKGLDREPASKYGYVVSYTGGNLFLAAYADHLSTVPRSLDGYILIPCKMEETCIINDVLKEMLRNDIGVHLPLHLHVVKIADGRVYVIPVFAAFYRVYPGSVISKVTLTIATPEGNVLKFNFPPEHAFMKGSPRYTEYYDLESEEFLYWSKVKLSLEYLVGDKFEEGIDYIFFNPYLYVSREGIAFLKREDIVPCIPDWNMMMEELNSILHVTGDCGEYCYVRKTYPVIDMDHLEYYNATVSYYFFESDITTNDLPSEPFYVESNICIKYQTRPIPVMHKEVGYPGYIENILAVPLFKYGSVEPYSYRVRFVAKITEPKPVEKPQEQPTTKEENKTVTEQTDCPPDSLKPIDMGEEKYLTGVHYIYDKHITTSTTFYLFCDRNYADIRIVLEVNDKNHYIDKTVKLKLIDRALNRNIYIGRVEHKAVLAPYSEVVNKRYICYAGACKYSGTITLHLPDDWFCYNDQYYYDVRNHKVIRCQEGCVEGGCKEMVKIKELAKEASEGNIPAYLQFLRGDIGDVLTYGLVGSVMAILAELPSILEVLPLIPGGMATVFLVTFSVVFLAFKIAEGCVKPELQPVVHETMWFVIALFGDIGALVFALAACIYSKLK